MTEAETITSLRASLVAAEAELLALTHRATTAEATVAALMADGAATLSALRDAAVAEEREACARVCDAEAAWQAKQGRTTEFVLRAVAREIRVRGTQEPRQRPEAPSDVAAAGVCEACGGSGRRPLAGQRPVRCDECAATGRVAMTVAATAAKWCPRCDGSGRRLHEGWRVVRCDECRTTGRVTAEVGR